VVVDERVGVVKEAPVKIGLPPVELVYHLISCAFIEVAERVTRPSSQRVAGTTVGTLGTPVIIVAATEVRDVDGQPLLVKDPAK
jgi:hypothetical protein